MLVEQINLFLVSVSFLTIIPVRTFGRPNNTALAMAAAYFPAAGLLIGALAAGLSWALDILFPVQATNAVLIFYLVVVTGGLHLDGLADTVDAIAGGRDRKSRLKIMQDGRIGPLGAAAVTMALLLKFVFLNNLIADVRLIAILTVPAMARWPMVLMIWRLPAAKKGGLGSIFARQNNPVSFGIATATILVLISAIVIVSSWLYSLLILVILMIAVFSAKVSRSLIGGVTGDTLGATVEISEVALFLAFGVIALFA